MEKFRAWAEAPHIAPNFQEEAAYVTLQVRWEDGVPQLWPHMLLVQTLDLLCTWQVRICELSQRQQPFPYSSGQVRVKCTSTATTCAAAENVRGRAAEPHHDEGGEDLAEEPLPEGQGEDEEDEIDPCNYPDDLMDFLGLQPGIALADGQASSTSSSSSSQSTSRSSSATSTSSSSAPSSPRAGGENRVGGAPAPQQPLQEQVVPDGELGQRAGGNRETHPESGPWGEWFYFTLRRGAQPGSGAWQALCKWHDPAGAAKCTKSLSFKSVDECLLVKKRLKLWLLEAPRHASKAEHTLGRRGLAPLSAAQLDVSDADLEARLNLLGAPPVMSS